MSIKQDRQIMSLLVLRASKSRTVVTRYFSTGLVCCNNEVKPSPASSTVSNVVSSINKKKRNRKKIIQELHGEVKLKDYKTIENESRTRFRESYFIPAEKWTHKMTQELDLERGSKEALKESLTIGKLELKTTDLFQSLDVGDVVELTTSLNQSSLSVVVEVPPNDKDPRYTVMNKLGELFWLEKSAVKFRIPRIIPKEWLNGIVYRVHDQNAEHGSIKTTLYGFERYSVNPFARKLIVSPLVHITNNAWNQIQENSRKLELLHRILQTDGPREVSFFSLLKAINFLELKSVKEVFTNNKNIEHSYDLVSKLLTDEFGKEFERKYGESMIGKEFEQLKPDDIFDASTFYSLALALRKQSRLWTSSYCSTTTLVPLSITVLPIQYANKIDHTVQTVKLDPTHSTAFHKFLRKGEFSELKPSLDPILFLLREYAVGNITDPKSITLVCNLMKVHAEEDINKSMVYDILTKTGFINQHLTNPLHFSTSLCLPNSGVSNKATTEQQYIDLIDVTKERPTDLAKQRTDYSDLRVYCIDSATAHEIDDGVSVRKIDDDNYMLYVHVADPASYMTKESMLTKVAYERASTIYQPEVVSPMLPKSLGDLAGLGNDNQKTRALTFSVPYKKSTNKVNIDKAKVEATNLSKFPKYTYDDVDKVLANMDSNNPEHQELNILFGVSKDLRKGRIENGAVIFGESLSTQVKVSESPKLENDSVNSEVDVSIVIDIQKETNSVILVSELMILGNKIAANILTKNGINGIYKGMEKLSLSDNTTSFVEKVNQDLLETSKLPSISEIVKLFKLITPAYYTSLPKRHLMLGVDGYAPSTSPLRRFGDLINHFGFHNYLNQETPLFSKEEAFSIALHMEAKNDILKKSSRKSGAYYSILEIEKYQGKNEENGNFIVSTRAYDGSVYGFFQKYGISAKMKLLKHRKPPAVGEILNNFEIIETDKVGGNVILQQL